MLDTLIDIAQTPGSLKKQAILRAHPELKQIVEYAYNPYKHYYMTEPPIDGEGFNSTIDFAVLDQMAKRALDTSMILKYISLMEYDTAEVFKRILNKDLRIGLGVKSINKVWPGLIPTFSVQLAKLYEPSRVSFPCFVCPKLDGIRAIYKNSQLYTRNGHVIQGVDHILRQVQHLHTLDGELLIPGLTFEESSGKLRSGHDVPDAVYYVFDSPSDDDLCNRLERIKGIDSSHVKYVPHNEVEHLADIMTWYHIHRQEGYEGSIVKTSYTPYYDGRNYDWMKIKNVDTHDLSVIGFYEGEGRLNGTLGGVIVDYFGVPVRVGSGFSDSERICVWCSKDSYLGKVCEIQAQEETSGKSLRHPRFIGWRFDKSGGIDE